jgi:hypothetical protein
VAYRQAFVPAVFGTANRSVVCRASGTTILDVAAFTGQVCSNEISTVAAGPATSTLVDLVSFTVNRSGNFVARWSFQWTFAQAPSAPATYFLRFDQSAVPIWVGLTACNPIQVQYAFRHEAVAFTCESVAD